MNTPLWMNISAFKFDEPVSEYGFSTRLAQENHWTADFTRKAITEYKKFMYLAATAEDMVAPSTIVDTVWHQHLLFTDSYASLCKLTGKPIRHIPSTHNREEAARFRQAASRTKELYHQSFDTQPAEIWEAEAPFDSLQLPGAQKPIGRFINASVLLFLALIVPVYYLLKPLYVRIDNPYFPIGYGLLALIVLTILFMHNETALAKIVAGFPDSAYVFHLQPSELIYLKKQRLEAVLHGNIDRLLREKRLILNQDQTLRLSNLQHEAATVEEHTVRQVIQSGSISYPVLLRQLIRKPVFTGIQGSMDAFRDSFLQSRAFKNLLFLNTCVLLPLLMLGVVRVLTGMAREKPVAVIVILTLLVLIAILLFLRYLSYAVCTSAVPEVYKNHLLPENRFRRDDDWQYFLMGNLVLSPDFVRVVNSYEGINDDDGGGSSVGDSSGSSGGSCGSGCGSSCGGCGGGGD